MSNEISNPFGHERKRCVNSPPCTSITTQACRAKSQLAACVWSPQRARWWVW